MRKRIIRLLIWMITGLVIIYVFLIAGLSLEMKSYRTKGYSLSEALKSEIRSEIQNLHGDEELSDYSCSKTGKLLSFSKTNDFQNGRANCIGYAQLMASISNYCFQQKGIPLMARPVVGEVHWYGCNLHKITNTIMPKGWKAFFADHDFVEINKGKRKIYMDPCLNDVIGWKCRTEK